MKYKLVSRKNPQNPQAAAKLYATPVSEGKLSQKDISAEIVALSSLTRGDVSNVVENILDVIPKYLLMGKSVSLGDLGTMRISFSSEGVNNAEEFTVSKISGVRVLFTPSPSLRQNIAGIKFEKA